MIAPFDLVKIAIHGLAEPFSVGEAVQALRRVDAEVDHSTAKGVVETLERRGELRRLNASLFERTATWTESARDLIAEREGIAMLQQLIVTWTTERHAPAD